MKRRNTILNTLKLNAPFNIQPLVSELFEEIRDYFVKMDLYFHFNKNTFLFNAIYIEGMTNLNISLICPLDTKSITKFVKDAEDFTKNIIYSFEKYKALIPYMYIN